MILSYVQQIYLLIIHVDFPSKRFYLIGHCCSFVLYSMHKKLRQMEQTL